MPARFVEVVERTRWLKGGGRSGTSTVSAKACHEATMMAGRSLTRVRSASPVDGDDLTGHALALHGGRRPPAPRTEADDGGRAQAGRRADGERASRWISPACSARDNDHLGPEAPGGRPASASHRQAGEEAFAVDGRAPA